MIKSNHIELLKIQYFEKLNDANRLMSYLVDQANHLLTENNIALGVPMEARVKKVDSIIEKIERKKYNINEIKEITDLIGLRFILLFRKDIDKVERILKETFSIQSIEDTSSRLADSQFGYQSRHYVLKIPETWRSVPTYRELQDFSCEIQVRTLAQHIWAAAEHKLQYKSQKSVPAPLKRNIYRISALLETVDLEFDRILDEREKYIDYDIPNLSDDDLLDVDVISSTLKSLLPPQNEGDSEDFDSLLLELEEKKIFFIGDLKKLITENLEKIMELDRAKAKEYSESNVLEGQLKQRATRGFFYSHTGLARSALIKRYGEKEMEEVFMRVIKKKSKMKVE